MTDTGGSQDWSDSISPEEWAAQRYTGLREHLYTTARLGDIPAPDPLIDGWLYTGSISWLFGDRGSFKSFVALDMAGCVGTGLHWHGFATKQAPVLYIALEGASGQARRVDAWQDWYGQPMQGVHFLAPRSLHVVGDQVPLTRIVQDVGAGMVIIDTQNRATTGLEENSSVDMGRMIAALDAVQYATGCGIVMVHHVGSGSHRPRGHTSIDGAAASMIRVARDGALVKVTNEKQKDGPPARPLLLVARARQDSITLVPEGDVPTVTITASQQMIMAALRNLQVLNGSATHAEIKRACTSQGMAESTFNWALRRCVEQGRLHKAQGKYTIVDTRQQTLDGKPATGGNTDQPAPAGDETASSWGPGTYGDSA